MTTIPRSRRLFVATASLQLMFVGFAAGCGESATSTVSSDAPGAAGTAENPAGDSASTDGQSDDPASSSSSDPAGDDGPSATEGGSGDMIPVSGAGGTPAIGGAPDDGTATGGTAGDAPTEGGEGAACPSDGWTPGDQTITLTHDGIERAYEVHVPPSYTGATPVPLMLVIHGAHNTPRLARNWSQMNPIADDNGFIVAYPAGIDCWNAGGILPGCTAADDDVGFLRTLVDDIESHACIDAKRVYATGISNGSMMAQVMGCQASDIFAAVGGVSAGIGGNCSPSRPLPVLYMHGTEDRTVSYASARPNVTRWANRNGCNAVPVETYNVGSTVCETYDGCDDGAEVVFCTVNGMGHCWPEDTNCGPGGGPAFGVSDFKASPMFWEFFERHPLP